MSFLRAKGRHTAHYKRRSFPKHRVCAGVIWPSLHCPMGIEVWRTSTNADTLITVVAVIQSFVPNPGLSSVSTHETVAG